MLRENGALQIYHDLLVKWQKAINLVSGKTLDEAWVRHFEDSEQLLAHIPAHVKIIADLGSGGGFPGMVLAILRPDLEVHLIESDERKCQFLKNVSRESSSLRPDGASVVQASPRAHIHNARVEDVLGDLAPDLITARAFAPLEKLIEYARPAWEANPGLEMLLLKGRGAADEVAEAREKFAFDVEFLPSKTDSEAQILRIGNLEELQL